jgi:VWFA-related protein
MEADPAHEPMASGLEDAPHPEPAQMPVPGDHRQVPPRLHAIEVGPCREARDFRIRVNLGVLLEVADLQHSQGEAVRGEDWRDERCYVHGVRFYAAPFVALFLALPALPVAAQFTETLEVRLLEIEATVVDREQKAIEGLTRDDFLVTIDGAPAEITNFTAITGGAVRETTAERPDEVVAMPVPTRLIVIVDDLHLHPEPKRRALDALRRYVDETMDAATTVTLVTWNGALTTRTTPTTRRELIRSAIDAAAKQIPRGVAADAERRQLQSYRETAGPNAAYRGMALNYAEMRADDAERTIRALEEVIAGTASTMEGRKIVLFISEGVPLAPGAEMLASANNARLPPPASGRLNKGPRLKNLAKKAREAGVVFSTLDPSHLLGTADNGMADIDLTLDLRMMRRNAHDSVSLLAKETGGRVVADHNDLDRALTLLDDQFSTYYSLAVRSPTSARRSPDIEVRLRDRPALRVHIATRRGLPSREEAIANAVRAQLTRRAEDNPLQARFFIQPEQHDTGCIASLQFLVPAAQLTLVSSELQLRGQLDLWFAVLPEGGVESTPRVLAVDVTSRHGSTIGHSVPIALTRGSYVVSAAVVDRLSGATSYLQRELECGK